MSKRVKIDPHKAHRCEIPKLGTGRLSELPDGNTSHTRSVTKHINSVIWKNGEFLLTSERIISFVEFNAETKKHQSNEMIEYRYQT